MFRRIFRLGAVLLAIAILPVATFAAAPSANDAFVDDFFAAIRGDNFKKATAHFNAKMKALSPEGLQASWKQSYESQGPLLRWQIFEHQTVQNGRQEVRVQLKFRSATANSIIVVDPKTREI